MTIGRFKKGAAALLLASFALVLGGCGAGFFSKGDDKPAAPAAIEIAGSWDAGYGMTITLTNAQYKSETADHSWDYVCDIVKYSNDGFNAGEAGEADCGYAVVKFAVHPNAPASVGKYTVLRWKNLKTEGGKTTMQSCEGYGTYFGTAAAAEAGATDAAKYFAIYSSAAKK